MAKAQEFRVDGRARRDQLRNIAASLFFIVALALALATQGWLRSRSGYAAAGALAALLLWVAAREVRMLRGRPRAPVVIDERGVRYASPGEVAWSEVAGIEQVAAMQRVDLLDAQGQVRVSLRYDLEEAGGLLQFVADMLAARWPQKPLPQEFSYRVPLPLMVVGASVLAALGGTAGLAYWLQRQPMIQALCLGALAIVVLCYLVIWNSSIRRLTIGSDGLVVARGIKPLGLYFTDIAAVGLALVERRKGERYLDVRVTMGNRTAISVLPRRGDPFEVYATLKRAWTQGRAAAAAQPSIPASAA